MLHLLLMKRQILQLFNPIQTFCASESPTVGDLQISDENPTGLTINVYDDYDPNDSSIWTYLIVQLY